VKRLIAVQAILMETDGQFEGITCPFELRPPIVSDSAADVY
jgi:hypothetical protein